MYGSIADCTVTMYSDSNCATAVANGTGTLGYDGDQNGVECRSDGGGYEKQRCTTSMPSTSGTTRDLTCMNAAAQNSTMRALPNMNNPGGNIPCVASCTSTSALTCAALSTLL